VIVDRYRQFVDPLSAQGQDFGWTGDMDFPHEETRFREHGLRAPEWRQAVGEQVLGAVMVRVVFR
jgi:hypothetical protein